MTAKLGYQPSFLWRSLIAARPTILEGTAWRIGKGRKVQIFEDRWIGMTNFEKPTCRTNVINPTAKVSDLIDFDAKAWRFDFIRQNFKAHDANRICAMHLSSRLPEDKMLWRHSKNGQFSGKTAYYAIKSKSENAYSRYPSASNSNGAWKKIWQLRILSKIKHFIWKACLNALPTKYKLVEKNIAIDPICAICGEGPETLTHLMLECHEVIPVWLHSPLRIDPSLLSFGLFKNSLWCTMDTSPMDNTELLCITAWCIWTARNKLCFEHKPFNAENVLHELKMHSSSRTAT
ncbi:hypothetical protein DH2020_003061 [Rehmannia glutinosa]|uniref:Reverse transcriptase zinc-binding domain-containing protein n=1 Tax=Rehmannia glutinosa TaxID=99300 RepID=A0ABR0XKQ0_REHGL